MSSPHAIPPLPTNGHIVFFGDDNSLNIEVKLKTCFYNPVTGH
jgi:hypothetical protein